MNIKDVLNDMRSTIGKQSPVVFFEKMVDVFSLLAEKIDNLENQLKKVETYSIMAIEWDERIALNMIKEEIDFLRLNGVQLGSDINIYQSEIDELKRVYSLGYSFPSYKGFCKFWQNLLGYHPFLEARK